MRFWSALPTSACLLLLAAVAGAEEGNNIPKACTDDGAANPAYVQWEVQNFGNWGGISDAQATAMFSDMASRVCSAIGVEWLIMQVDQLIEMSNYADDALCAPGNAFG
jgi:hypothetical protein